MEKTQRILDFTIEQCDSITKYYHGSQRSNIMFFSLSMLDRLNFSSHSLKALTKDIYENSRLEYSCGIIIRSVLLDYMILLNAIEPWLTSNPTGNETKDLYNYCSKWLADSMRHTVNNIALLYSDSSSQELDIMYLNIINRNPDFFYPYENTGKPPKIKLERPEKTEDLYKKIKQGKFNYDAKVYEAYLYYSKYDHFGQMFYETSREFVLDKINRMNKSISFFPYILHYSLLILSTVDNNLNPAILNRKKEIISFIESL